MNLLSLAEGEKAVSNPNKLLSVSVTKIPIYSSQIWKVYIMLHPLELKKVSKGLEMYFYTRFQILCYNFRQDPVREQSFKLEQILSATQIHPTHWWRVSMAQAECFQFWKDRQHRREFVLECQRIFSRQLSRICWSHTKFPACRHLVLQF